WSIDPRHRERARVALAIEVVGPVRGRFENRIGVDHVAAIQVRDGARRADDPVEAAGRDSGTPLVEALPGRLDPRGPGAGGARGLRGHIAVDEDAEPAQALALAGPRRLHARGDRRRRLRVLAGAHLRQGDVADPDLEIDAIEDRPADAAAVALEGAQRAGA